MVKITDIRMELGTFFLIGILGGGVEFNWVHSALRPLIGDYDDEEICGMTGKGN
jgi:hypothetical protein